jgi:hypothetical protein
LSDESPGTDTAPRPESKTGTEQEDQSDEAPSQQSTQSLAIDRAPKSWKPATRGKWESLDPEVRQEVVRREREITRALGESTNHRKFAGHFQEVIQPFAQRYQQSGLPPLQIIHNLMSADTLLATAPMEERAKFMAKMIQDYKIDIGVLDSALGGEDPGSQPISIVERMISEKLAPLQSFVQQNQQTRQQQEAHELEVQRNFLQSMEEDEVNFPHFATVKQDMADLIELNSRRGVYLDPKAAYTRAVAMNPEASAAEQGRLAQQGAQQAHQAATRSLGASLSVNGAPMGLKKGVDPGDLRGTIEAAWLAHNGR